jgi:hypothetical protein
LSDKDVPKKKQINVSIPEAINEGIEDYLKDNEVILKRLGIRSKAQLVAAILENGMLGFDRMVQAAKQACEEKR